MRCIAFGWCQMLSTRRGFFSAAAVPSFFARQRESWIRRPLLAGIVVGSVVSTHAWAPLCGALVGATSCGSRPTLRTSFCSGAGCESTLDILSHTKVVPYGVLGSSSVGNVAPEPDAETAFVDPAGLHHIEGGPSGAGGAAGVIYRWLGIASKPAFPDPVRAAITRSLLAKFHAYGDRKCIHVVGPDLRTKPYTRAEAVDELAEAYKNVLVEFCNAGLKTLRLLPVSGGIFSGPFSKELPGITAEALEKGFRQLSTVQQEQVLAANVEMCIFMANELLSFERPFLANSVSGEVSRL